MATIDTEKFIQNDEIKSLIDSWKNATDTEKKQKIREQALQKILELEKDIFYSRYELRDVDTRINQDDLLEDIPPESLRFHKPEDYEKTLVSVLKENNNKLSPNQAIKQVFTHMKDRLLPGDFIRGENNVYRFVTNIRFAAANLKKKHLLRQNQQISHRIWILSLNIPEIITHAIVNMKQIVGLGIKQDVPKLTSTNIVRLLYCKVSHCTKGDYREYYEIKNIDDFSPQTLLFDLDNHESDVAIKIYNLPESLQNELEKIWIQHKEEFIKGFSIHDDTFEFCVDKHDKLREKYGLNVHPITDQNG